MSDRAIPPTSFHPEDEVTPRTPSPRAQAHALDQAVYDAVADTPTPSLDRFLVGVSRSADRSRL